MARKRKASKNVIKRSELTNFHMVSGREKEVDIVIDTEVRLVKKQWVGIGWIVIGEATSEDIKKYPHVIEG